MGITAYGVLSRGLLSGHWSAERVGVRILQVSAPTAPPDEETEMEESAQRATERTHALGIAERERALLAEVERALAKIRGGTYGRSEATGDPIPYARLAAVPWARTGVDE